MLTVAGVADFAEPRGRSAERGLGELIRDVEPWPEAVDGRELLDELSRLLTEHVVLPGWAADTLALWCLHTYAFELRDVGTYIGVESPEKRCGKTTLLGVLGRLVRRPVVAANISSRLPPEPYHPIVHRTRFSGRGGRAHCPLQDSARYCCCRRRGRVRAR